MGHIKLVSGAVMAALFSIVLIIYAAQFAVDNDADINIINDSQFNSLNNTLQQNISQFRTEAGSSVDSFIGTTLESGDEHAATGAQFKVGVFEAMGAAMSSFKVSVNKITGGEERFSFLFLTLSGLLAYIAFLYAYKAWFGRNPD